MSGKTIIMELFEITLKKTQAKEQGTKMTYVALLPNTLGPKVIRSGTETITGRSVDTLAEKVKKRLAELLIDLDAVGTQTTVQMRATKKETQLCFSETEFLSFNQILFAV